MTEAPTKREIELVLNAEPEHVTPDYLKRECERCKQRGEHLRQVASGHGTIDEIREAIKILALWEQRGRPWGMKLRLNGRWLCPRCDEHEALAGTDRVTRRQLAGKKPGLRYKRKYGR